MNSEEENLRKTIEEAEKKIMDAKTKLEAIEKKKFEKEITELQGKYSLRVSTFFQRTEKYPK